MSHSTYVIRDYVPADETAALDVWYRAWKELMPQFDWDKKLSWFLDYWRNKLVLSAHVIVACLDEGGSQRVVGFATIDLHTGYMDQLAVAPEHHGSPAAALLIEKVKSHSPMLVILEVNSVNGRAIRFYEKHGFVKYAEGESRLRLPTWKMCWKPHG